jgi:excisionase family DNA binding protein
MTPDSVYPEIMTIEQAAEYLQLHPQVVYRHVRGGTLPASRIGRTIRFKRSVLDAFLERGAWVYANAFLNYVASARGMKAPPRPPLETPGPLLRANGAAADSHATVAEVEAESAPAAVKGPFSVDVD